MGNKGKLKYEVVFSNGEKIKRSSYRLYTHAWGVFFDGKLHSYGFSSRHDLAEKEAAARYLKDIEPDFRDKKTRLGRSVTWRASVIRWLKEYHDGSWEKYREDYRDKISRMKTEIVETKGVV
jgi:hypothetical protein